MTDTELKVQERLQLLGMAQSVLGYGKGDAATLIAIAKAFEAYVVGEVADDE
jgi:hypothetical protein